jgi:hypothetical protein
MKSIWAVGVAGYALALWGQAPQSAPAPAPSALPDSSAQQLVQAPETRPARTSFQVVREIDDRPTHKRWLLERDRNRPSSPGRMVLISNSGAVAGQDPEEIPDSQPLRAALPAPPIPVIRAGDRLVVEENTPVVEARLTAIALGPAVAGAVLNVRLEIGGKVIRALATGPGRAKFAPGIGGQP